MASRPFLGRLAGAGLLAFSLAVLPSSAEAQAVQPNPSSPLKLRKVLVLEGGSIDAVHLASRNATWANFQAMADSGSFAIAKGDAEYLTEASHSQYDILAFNYFWETEME